MAVIKYILAKCGVCGFEGLGAEVLDHVEFTHSRPLKQKETHEPK